MIYFIIYLFLEVLLSISISSSIGELLTFLEIMISAFVGISILINFRKTLVENITVVSYNCIDLAQFQSLNLFTLFGAILLIIPGVLTDILGIIMQFSVCTSMFISYYNVKSGKYDESFTPQNNLKKDSYVIDVEIINNNTTIN